MTPLSRTILVVEGNPTDRAQLCRYLSQDPCYAYNLLEAATAEAGLEQYRSAHPDALLLGSALPGINGFAFLQALPSLETAELPIVLLTEPEDETRAAQAVQQGARQYLRKSELTLETLRLALHSVLKQGELLRQIAELNAQNSLAIRAVHQQVERQRLVMEITQHIRRSLNLQDILQTTVDEVRQFLQTDRVIIFEFSANWGGKVAVESVVDEQLAILPFDIYDPCVGEQYVEPFKQGLVTAKSDIYAADISPCHVEFLAQFQVRANLVVPILKEDELWGLLVAHHCTAPRQWQESEIDLLQQLSSQVSIALQQADLFKQVQTELEERKQVEIALQSSQAQLQRQLVEIETIYQSAPIGLNVLDTRLRFVRINQRLAEMNGHSVEAHLGRTVREMLPSLADAAEQLLRPILETGEPLLNVEINGETPAQPGVQRTWLESFLPLKEGDRVIGISTVCEEITARKQAEVELKHAKEELEQRVAERTAELRETNNRLLIALMEQQQSKQILTEQAKLLDLAHNPIMTRDLNTVITFWNQGAERLYGWTKAEALGQKSHKLLKTQFPQPLAELEAELLQNGYWEGELIHTSRDHRPIIALSRWVLQKDEAGQPIKVLEINNDITERKQAEQALALQAVIARNMAEGVCLVRADNGMIVYANPKFEQMFGYGPGELNGQHVSIVNYASETVSAEEVNQSIRAAVLANREVTYEVHNVKKDGTPFWCSATCSTLSHPEYGEVLVAVHQDITAAKRLEAVRKETEAAQQQQTRQEQLLWHVTQAIRQSLDLNAVLNTAVSEVRQTLQVDRVAVYRFNPDWSGDFIAESAGAEWVKLLHSDTLKVWKDSYLQDTQGGRFRHHESFVVPDIYRAGLEACHIELLEQFQARAYAVVPIFSGDLLWGLLAIYQNTAAYPWQAWEVELLQQIASQLAIAIQQSELYRQLQIELQERQQSAAVLREAERRWRSLLNNVQLIVVGLDRTGAINYVNPFFLSLTEYTEAEVLGKNWFETFLPRSTQQTLQTVFSEILVGNTYPYYQNSILTKSGEERFIAWNNTMLQDSSGNTIGTISIGEDITERQKIEQIKSEFISIVSHELRTPLTALRLSLGLLKTGVYDQKPDKFHRMIDIALMDTNRLVNLVNDILDLERLESGRAVLEKTLCHASDLMQQAVDGMQTIAAQQHITLTLAPSDIQVWAAADAIIQTLTNLLSNAIKFSSAGSNVRVSAERQPDAVLFQVSDEGRGIPPDKLELIFGRFQQVDASDSREKGGTGLGLAICRSIVERHGGQIWVESTLGQGSTFFFTLPVPPTGSSP